MAPTMSRRSFLVGIGAGGAAVVAGGVALRRRGEGEAPGPVPEAAVGDERVERRRSEARGTDVDFYTAVPEGLGDRSGLPVCLVLHGASATAADRRPSTSSPPASTGDPGS